jgi:hypothetical protein
MTLSTGIPLGTTTNQDNIYIEGAPDVWFQDFTAGEQNNPDANAYYWGLSGTTTYPAYGIGCLQDVTLADNLTVNAIRCDNLGDKGIIQKRNHLEFNLTISTILPLSVLRHIMRYSIPYTAAGIEKLGVGKINNNRYYHVYLAKVYDEDVGDYVSITLHRAQFVNASTINMRAGEPWNITGISIWAFADDTKPANQSFATIIRSDLSALP